MGYLKLNFVNLCLGCIKVKGSVLGISFLIWHGSGFLLSLFTLDIFLRFSMCVVPLHVLV